MNTVLDEVGNAVFALFGQPPDKIEEIKGGRNNICLKVSAGRKLVLAKKYFVHKEDPRNRLGAEFSMLSFLWSNGVRCIPEPLDEDRETLIGFYEFVEGTKPSADEISGEDVKRLATLLGDMWRLRSRPGATVLPPGSDASFAFQDYVNCVRGRMESIVHCAGTGCESLSFREFVEKRLTPVFEELMRYIERRAEEHGLDQAAELTLEKRTLSPADHGFHNVIRRKDGSLVFIDFEYAGWDDPAQMICNACLQPEVPIPSQFLNSFLKDVFKSVDGDEALVARLRLAYPLLAFKWCLIMLNEFLPVSDERRRFAGTEPETRRTEQLKKAERQLRRVEDCMKGKSVFGGLAQMSA